MATSMVAHRASERETENCSVTHSGPHSRPPSPPAIIFAGHADRRLTDHPYMVHIMDRIIW